MNRKKKIVVISQYYYPEVASTAQIYKELCEFLASDYEVNVICSVPCYSGIIDSCYKEKRFYTEEYNGVNITRVRVSDFNKTDKLSRIKHIIGFYINTIKAVKLFRNKNIDVVLTYSQPPILGGMLGVIAKRILKSKLIYNIQDFNPEQIMAVNYAGNRFLHKILMVIDKRSCKKADLVVTVGRDMQETLVKRFKGKNVPKNVVINNWINEDEIYPLPADNEKVLSFKEKYGLLNKFVIMSSGNIGLFYDFENLIRIMDEFREREDVVFVFAGDGAVKPKLVDYVNKKKLENVKFIPYQPKEELIYSLNAADVHIVTNAKGIKGISVPSKIYGVLAVDKPVIGILEKGSEAWNIIEEAGCGVLCEAGEYNRIRKVFIEVVDSMLIYFNKYKTGRKFLVVKLSSKKSLEMYKNIVEKLSR